MKTFLYIMRRPPYDGLWTQECIDQLLTAAAFDQRVRVLFLGDGVFQLLHGQSPDAVGRKSVVSLLRALPMYDVKELFAEDESLQERGLLPAQLALPVRILPRAQIPDLLNDADLLLGC